MRGLRIVAAVAKVSTVAAAVASFGLVLGAGHSNDSRILVALFAIWVLSPFVVLVVANMLSKHWSVHTQATLHGLSLVIVVGSLAIYGNAVLLPPGSKIAFPFLVVPFGAWVLVASIVPLSALISGRLSRWEKARWLIRAVAGVAMFGVVGIVVLLGLLLLDHERETTLPMQTGSFAVGRTAYVWSDPAHRDAMAPTPGAKRELLAWIWYPAAPRQPSQTFDDYLPAPWRAALEQQTSVLLRQFLTRDLSRIRVHSIRDAELSPLARSYPVILMRGGHSALVADYTSLAEDLASHGYVVAGFDAPYRSFVVVFPDGRVISRAPQNDAELVGGAEKVHLAEKLVQAWSADMSFALDKIERLNTADPSGRFTGRLDLQRVGAFGHSLGGATALQFCHDDPRCKAGIDVDGAPFGSVVGEGVTQPLMFLMSDHRGETDPESRWVEANFHAIYDRTPRDRRLQIMIQGANHFMFSDGAMLKSPILMGVLRMLGVVGIDGRRQIALSQHYISTFFDVYLKGAPATQLRTQAGYPEIVYTR